MPHIAHAIIKSTDEFGRDQYLMLEKYTDLGDFSGFWNFPNIEANNEENAEETLKNEIKRAIDLEVKNAEKFHEEIFENKILSWWKYEIESAEFKILLEEIADAEFFTFDQMSAIPIIPATKEFFEDKIFMKKIIAA